MKHLLPLLLLLLPACIEVSDVYPRRPIRHNWATFEQPPAGTPCMLRVFYLPKEHVDLPGAWGDNKPYMVSFPIYRDIKDVVRVEVHYMGHVIAARSFHDPVNFTKGKTAGWEK
jgi:hypothetical protein